MFPQSPDSINQLPFSSTSVGCPIWSKWLSFWNKITIEKFPLPNYNYPAFLIHLACVWRSRRTRWSASSFSRECWVLEKTYWLHWR
jgi:hypothetical protein